MPRATNRFLLDISDLSEEESASLLSFFRERASLVETVPTGLPDATVLHSWHFGVNDYAADLISEALKAHPHVVEFAGRIAHDVALAWFGAWLKDWQEKRKVKSEIIVLPPEPEYSLLVDQYGQKIKIEKTTPKSS